MMRPLRGGVEQCWLFLCVFLTISGTHVAADRGEPAPQLQDCLQVQQQQSSALQISRNCTWRSTGLPGIKVSISGARKSQGLHSSNSATPFILAVSPREKPSTVTGVRLQLERLVLFGFPVAAPDPVGQQPLLWPSGLTAGSGEYLNMTDVRVVVSSQELFNKYLEFFTNQNTLIWTDSTNFIHIQQWSDTHTQLRSVGLLMASPDIDPATSPALPLIKNCFLWATNTTLVPALIPHAAVATPLPLLVYLASNVSLGLHPPLPAAGLLIKRPIVLVGLASLVTSIDFEMVVNQLNATVSPYANTTFVGVALENLAPGDIVTSAMASPFSIAITNNLWAVYYNRSIPQKVRWALYNTTLVLPQDSEMAYITYMFTLYTSPLQYLKEQTQFYSDVLHMSMLQFMPGPGTHAITVQHILSWYHRWGNVILTTEPLVATQLPVPARPMVLTSSVRVSPLVQAVRTAEELKAFAETAVIGDRDHILLFLANVSLATLADSGSNSSNSAGMAPVRIASALSWVGYNPGSHKGALNALGDASLAQQQGNGDRVSLDFNFQRGAVVISPALPKDALQVQQLVLSRLPQGPNAAVPSQMRALPGSLMTLLLWSFDRPPDTRSLHLIGVTLLLPGPEFEYLTVLADATNDFVVEIAGSQRQQETPPGGRGDAITFENAYQQGNELRVATITGPGFIATNVTLREDPDAVAAMPGGYHWPDPSQLRLPPAGSSHPRWVLAVIAVCVTLAVLLLALAGFMWWQRRRICMCMRDAEAGLLQIDSGSSFDKVPSRASCPGHSPGCGSHNGSGGVAHGHGSSRCSDACSGAATCPQCALQMHNSSSQSADVQASTLDNSKHSPRPAKGSGDGELSPTGTAAAGGSALAAASARRGARSPCSHRCQSQRDAAPAASTLASDSTTSLHDNVAAGMQRWRAAVSSTTMLLMERRMDAAAGVVPAAPDGCSGAAGRASSNGMASSSGTPAQPHMQDAQGEAGAGTHTANSSGGNAVAAQQQQQLQLQELLGQGSFGSVFLAVWRGKKVAVKIMQLPASALLEPGEQLGPAQQQQQQQHEADADGGVERRRQLQRQRQQNSKPHMAIMEAVVSSTMSHPNVVQVFTYMLSPLTSTGTGPNSEGPLSDPGNTAAGGGSNGQDIAGWSLKLVMEYCDEGSLRDALDCGLLAKPGGYLAPAAVLALAHDVASAMLHLHSEGIVHGDLKAGNVMLTSSSTAGSSGSLPGVRMWARGSDRPLTAKVADFGLALPLGPRDTHATLLARGTPTHMSPELFMAGHVSKASDVYAYGILLYEIMTGRRAYAGVPIPLLPHEVARQGLRPEWPHGLPPGCRDLRRLAEACWAHQPSDRPSFSTILSTLDIWSAGGHGWPAVPLSQRSIRPWSQRKQQQQQQQEVQLQAALQQPYQQATVQEQQQQQQQQEQLPSPASLSQQVQQQKQQQQQQGKMPTQPIQQQQTCQPDDLQRQQQQQQQPQQQMQQPKQQQQQQTSAGQHSQQQQPPPPPQQQQPPPPMPPQQAEARHAGLEPGGRNRHMSWSEVDYNDGCDGSYG